MSLFEKAAEAYERKLAEEKEAAEARERKWEEARKEFRAHLVGVIEKVARPLFRAEAASATARGYAADVVEHSLPHVEDPYIDFRFVPTKGSLLVSAAPASQVASFRIRGTPDKAIEYFMVIDARGTPDITKKGRYDGGGLEKLFEEFLVASLNRGE